MEDIYTLAVYGEFRKLTKEEAELSIKQTKNRTKRLLEDGQGINARNRIDSMIQSFKKWGYRKFIPQLKLLRKEIKKYIENNPYAGMEPNLQPRGDRDPLPPFQDEGKYLLMKDFRRTNFPDDIFDHPQIEKLAIAGDWQFERGFPLKIPDKFEKLPNLRYLALNYMDIGPLPVSIASLTNLEYLSIYHGIIREIPTWIGKLTSLKELHLNSQGFMSLPNSIGDLQSLEVLNMSRSGTPVILPNTISNLKNLRILRQ